MIQSTKCISVQSKKRMIQDIKNHIQTRKPKNPYCRSLRKHYSLEKFIEISIERNKSTKYSLQCFYVALDILKKEKTYEMSIINGHRCYEVTGLDKNGITVKIHLREEGDVIFLISAFYDSTSLKKEKKYRPNKKALHP